MIKNIIREILGESICEDELDFILIGIHQDILRNRLYAKKPKKTRLSYIIRVAIKIHFIWQRCHNEFFNQEFCKNLSNEEDEIVFKGNSKSEKIGAF